MIDENLHFETLESVSGKIMRREVSSREVVDHMLQRVSEIDPVLQAYTYVAEDSAHDADVLDEEYRRGHWRGPLHGVPMAIKDIYGDHGRPLEAGMPSRKGMTADTTATVVQRLRDAGAIILGRVHTTEGVYGEHTFPFEPPKNPWGLDRWVGVSSSGSGSSTAGGLAFATLGSDTGGSIRMPSSANGVTGLKPTWGRCSRYGVFELAGSLDHVGPMARSARDAGIVLEAIAGFDPKDPTSLSAAVDRYGARTDIGLSGTRIGIDITWALTAVSETVRGSMLAAIATLEDLGAEIVPVSFPDPEQINDDWFTVCGVQTALAHGKWFDEHEATYGEGLREVINIGKRASAIEYQEVLKRRSIFKGAVENVLSTVDIMFIPGLPYEAPLASDMVKMGAEQLAEVHRYTVPFTMSQMPTITFPIGFTPASSLPVAGQLVGAALTEKDLVRVANAFQQVTDFHNRHPEL
ncbi:amidase [Brevibacterium sp. RIT 803]|uniref:amidase n=1 Tax=Brevibacterium sp. RIT 803 TaxID=2810210 RepID=UPI00194E3315|nr:amidase [Brevibacterium sp. RIT 803]MBM6590471.1 amidase [Brevibacterium sp. RIT 803]